MLVVAGIDPLAEARSGLSGYLPSGRQAVFSMLIDAVLEKYPKKNCIVVARDKKVLRVQRQFRRQVQFDLIDASTGYADRIAADALLFPGLLVIDRLEPEYTCPAFEAAQRCLVLTQLNTVFYGAQVVRQLAEMCGSAEDAAASCWVLTVQRMPALCAHCKVPVVLTPDQIDRLNSRLNPGSRTAAPPVYYQGRGCPKCNHTGRFGDVAVFDVFYQERKPAPISNSAGYPSLLGIETYIYELVRSGYLPVDDLLDFEAAQLRRTFDLFQKMERALIEKKSSLESRLVQLEAAHKVLQKRTEALITLQTISQGMIASGDLGELARHICRYACQLCDADRAILYSLGQDGNAEVLAVFGWDPALVRRRLDMDAILDAQVGPEPIPFDRLPPGISPAFADQRPLGAGLAVSLYIQHEWVGLMILHAEGKNRFLPGEVALLQTFANQAALAIQRAGLVEQLRARLDQLEAAQAELARRERLEREMELARQVQQSLLPQGFPDLPGFRFAARCVPARQVGGDFYDVIPLEDGAFGLAIADVSDKGMPAALYMALARSLLRVEAQRERSPEAVLRTVNRLLLELAAPSLFVTLFYGIVEPGTRQLTYVRAGHEVPYVLRDGKLRPLVGEGIALGLLDPRGFRVSEEQMELYPGDRLILFTDGLTDVFDPDGQIYDRERLEQLLLGSGGVPLEALCESVFAALARFQGESEQFDDMTMLVVEVG